MIESEDKLDDRLKEESTEKWADCIKNKPAHTSDDEPDAIPDDECDVIPDDDPEEKSDETTDSEAKKNQYYMHEMIFQCFMEELEVAKDVLKGNLSKEVVDVIDFSTLSVVKSGYISKQLKVGESGILYHGRTKNRSDVYVYCLYQYAMPDKTMSLRFLDYTCSIMKEHLDQNEGAKLPLVFPILIYNGDLTQYPYPLTML